MYIPNLPAIIFPFPKDFKVSNIVSLGLPELLKRCSNEQIFKAYLIPVKMYDERIKRKLCLNVSVKMAKIIKEFMHNNKLKALFIETINKKV